MKRKTMTPVCPPMPQTLSEALNVLRNPGGGMKLVSHGFQTTRKSALDDLDRAVRRLMAEEGLTAFEVRSACSEAIKKAGPKGRQESNE